MKEKTQMMNFTAIMETSGIPFLLCAACAYFALRLHLSKDPSIFVGRDAGPLRDPSGYCRGAVRILVFFSAASLLMGILLLFDYTIAILEIIAATVIMMFMWKNLNDAFGPADSRRKR